MRYRFPLIAVFALSVASCSNGGDGQKQRPAPVVQGVTVTSYRFINRIDAVGTAYAREQVTLAAPVTERITRLNFSDGDRVQAGQVIAVLVQGQEVASLNEAQARAREAGQQLTRLKELKARGFATNASLDAQMAAAAAARAQTEAAKATIADRVVRAPFSGYVSLRNISPGAIVAAGTEIVTIADLSEIKLDFSVPETMLSAVSEGQGIVAKAAAYPELTFRGTIASINPIVDPLTRSVMIRARLPNADRKLRPGMLMTVSIESAPRNRLGIPELAIISEGDARFAYVIGTDNKVRRTRINTGVRQDGIVEVIDGLRAGQKIVGDGIVKVSDGMAVQLAKAEGASPDANSGRPASVKTR